MRYFFLISLMTVVMMGCASVNETRPATTTSPTSQPSSSVDSLKPRDLAVGECGLFVWAGEARRFILFVQTETGAVLARDGQEVPLSIQSTDQDADFYGQDPVQNLVDADGKLYRLNLSNAEAIDGGIRYSQGTWRYKDEQGWDVLTPVYGLSSCRTNG